MSISTWYFARNKNLVGSLTVVSSVGKTFIFHAGTAAFGGLIVAIVEASLFAVQVANVFLIQLSFFSTLLMVGFPL